MKINMLRTLLYIIVLMSAFFFIGRWVEARKKMIDRQKRLQKQGYSKTEAKQMAWEEFYKK
jgi:serine protease inhibitor